MRRTVSVRWLTDAGAHHEGAFRAGAIDGFLQALLDDLPAAVKPQRIAHRPEYVFAHRFLVHLSYRPPDQVRWQAPVGIQVVLCMRQ